jgi:hypothetical protein
MGEPEGLGYLCVEKIFGHPCHERSVEWVV